MESLNVFPLGLLWAQATSPDSLGPIVVGVLVLVALVLALVLLPGVRFIPNNRVGIVEKLWSGRGSVPAIAG